MAGKNYYLAIAFKLAANVAVILRTREQSPLQLLHQGRIRRAVSDDRINKKDAQIRLALLIKPRAVETGIAEVIPLGDIGGSFVIEPRQA